MNKSKASITKSNSSYNPRLVCCFFVLIWIMVLLTLGWFGVLELGMLKGARERSQEHSIVAKNSSGHFDERELNGIGLNNAEHTNATIKEDYTEYDQLMHNHTLPFSNTTISNDDETTLKPRKKGRLIMHVGPSKTATTTLQTELTTAQDAGWLSLDHVMYAGRYYHPVPHHTKGLLVLNRSESVLLTEARMMRNHPSSDNGDEKGGPCCTGFVAELTSLYQSKLFEYRQINSTNATDGNFSLTVIVSDEHFGNSWSGAHHYQEIALAIGSEWDVVVVAGYRRFYEWILSSNYQRDRTDRMGIGAKELWPSLDNATDRSKAAVPRGIGRELQPFIATFSNWRNTYRFTDSILQHVNGTFPIRFINLHSTAEKPLLSQFLCAVMNGTAPRACQMSRHRDAETEEHTTLNSQDAKTIPSLFYDAIATEASRVGLVDTQRFTRRHVRDRIRVYHESDRQLKPDDLALMCPSAEQLAAVLAVSMAMERLCLPELAAARNETDHRKGFAAKVETKAYCWVNATAVLEERHWRAFFEQFTLSQDAVNGTWGDIQTVNS